MEDQSTMVASSSSSSSSMCEMIPEDVMFHILLRLPVSSLQRFKSVCKSWLSHIDSSLFISQHTHRNSNLGDNKLIIMHDTLEPDSNLRLSFIHDNDLHLSNYVVFSPTVEDHLVYDGVLVSSLDGVICLRYRDATQDVSLDLVSLWNPATKQFAILPPPLQSDLKMFPWFTIEYGFGFDFKTNDYKVVRVVVEDLRYNLRAIKSRAEVYSLSMDSWRVVDADVPLKLHVTSNLSRPFLNEFYFWLGYDLVSRVYSILSFNFINETFGTIAVPELYADGFNCKPVLTSLGEKVACIDWVAGDSEHQIGPYIVWALDEYGVKESWTKMYTITLDQLCQPLGFSMDGKLIWREVGDWQKLCLYDPLTQEVNEVLTPGIISEVGMYKESLVSVKSANGVTKRMSCEVSCEDDVVID